MKLQWLPLIAFVLVNLLVDLFIYRKLAKSKHWHRHAKWWHATVATMLTAMLATVLLSGVKSTSNSMLVTDMYLLWGYFALNSVKWISLAIYSLSWVKWLKQGTRRLVRITAMVVAMLLIAIETVGTFVTPFTFQVKEVTIASNNLPKAFDGYTIVLFSDLHLGFYGSDTTFVAQCVEQMNALSPDLMCFTGDLVSRKASEAAPFVATLGKLRARHGVLAVGGNHDTGYYTWATPTQARQDMKQLKQLQEQMGWTMLDAGHIVLKQGGDSIVVVGVPYQDKKNFTPTGYLDKAYPHYRDNSFKILLQHNPEQWQEQYGKLAHIDLMLSGHTHAMQMVFSILGRDFSPASLKCKWWGGLYHEKRQGKDQYLYTNTGLGQVGIPARLGATPEITYITLKRTNK